MGVIFRYPLKVIRYQLLYMVQQREKHSCSSLFIYKSSH